MLFLVVLNVSSTQFVVAAAMSALKSELVGSLLFLSKASNSPDIILSANNKPLLTLQEFEIMQKKQPISYDDNLRDNIIIAYWLDAHGVSNTPEYQRDFQQSRRDSIDDLTAFNYKYFTRKYPLFAVSKDDYQNFISQGNKQDLLKKFFTILTMKTIKLPIGEENSVESERYNRILSEILEKDPSIPGGYGQQKPNLSFADIAKKHQLSSKEYREFQFPAQPEGSEFMYIYEGDDNWFEPGCPINFVVVGAAVAAEQYVPGDKPDEWKGFRCYTYTDDKKVMQQTLPSFEELISDPKYKVIKENIFDEIRKTKNAQLKQQALEQIKSELNVKENLAYLDRLKK